MADTLQRVDEAFVFRAANLAICLDHTLQRRRYVFGAKARTGDLADSRFFVRAATKGDLVEFFALTVDAQNADMADMVVTTGSR